MDRYLVISSDCHAGLPNEQYREWLDPEFRPAFDDSLADRARLLELAQRGILNEEFAEEWERENEEGLRGGWDAARRDKELEADGVVGEVLFPDADAVSSGASAPFGAGLSAGGDADPTLLLAGARAHNRWLAEMCALSPERRAGIAIVPIFDVPAAVQEIHRARESGLRGGILIPSMWTPYPPYHDPVYEPVWAACAELQMPVHVHSGNADKASYGAYVGMYVTEVRWWSTRPLHFLLWAGVFERHPDLRFVATECGAFWAADLLWMMDTAYDREHGAKKLGEQLTAHLSMRPSAYFDRNCSIGAARTCFGAGNCASPNKAQNRPRIVSAALPFMSLPAEAAVGEVLGTFSVVVAMIRTRSSPRPSSSATTWATFTYSPCPISIPPWESWTLPSV